MSAPRGVFIAGTDTGVGKTWVSCGLLRSLARSGVAATGMKPVATGAVPSDGRLLSEDVYRIAQVSVKDVDPVDRNPYCFEPPVSPDIAARRAGVVIEPRRVLEAWARLRARADWVVVEGTGGWLTPIGPSQTMADLASALELPVLLVVGLRLGCINHALLSAASIRARGCRLVGWVANALDPDYLLPEENLATLARFLGAPPLAQLRHGAPEADPAFDQLATALRALA